MLLKVLFHVFHFKSKWLLKVFESKFLCKQHCIVLTFVPFQIKMASKSICHCGATLLYRGLLPSIKDFFQILVDLDLGMRSCF